MTMVIGMPFIIANTIDAGEAGDSEAKLFASEAHKGL